MVDKKPTSDTWPVVSGDYIVGDPESPVAVVTLASHNEDVGAAAGAAISGPCKTENLGIEKVIANTVSNPNIRFMILCGAEVQGHITGESIKALHANGCDPEKKKITGAPGAIPFVENIPMDGVERFQNQMEIVDLIDVEDAGQITAKVKECIDAETALIEARIRNIDTQIKLIGAVQRNMAGNYAGKVQGIMMGLAFTLVLGFLFIAAPILGL